MSRMDVASVLVAEKQLVPDQVCTSSISFSIVSDDMKIQECMSYTIRAVIRDKEGKMLWITETHTPVFTRGGRPSDMVDVTVKRVAK